MNMSFSEKSAWISLAVVVYIWGDYAIGLYSLHTSSAPLVDKQELILQMITTAVIAVIIVESVFHAVLAMAHPKKTEQQGDERDRAIALQATNVAYTILFTGVIMTIGHLLWVEHFGRATYSSSFNIPFIEVNILLFSALLAEVFRFGFMLKEYRLGV
ncbi:hypothetical protein [Alteromonas flava]|uniref:hypothetical protein n=1 Tax=Alteromonas flava TaxID=2048003 RepID=UPI000C2856BF|nr:hypothetical protein [Alteromonas flava]